MGHDFSWTENLFVEKISNYGKIQWQPVKGVWKAKCFLQSNFYTFSTKEAFKKGELIPSPALRIIISYPFPHHLSLSQPFPSKWIKDNFWKAPRLFISKMLLTLFTATKYFEVSKTISLEINVIECCILPERESWKIRHFFLFCSFRGHWTSSPLVDRNLPVPSNEILTFLSYKISCIQ